MSLFFTLVEGVGGCVYIHLTVLISDPKARASSDPHSYLNENRSKSVSYVKIYSRISVIKWSKGQTGCNAFYHYLSYKAEGNHFLIAVYTRRSFLNLIVCSNSADNRLAPGADAAGNGHFKPLMLR